MDGERMDRRMDGQVRWIDKQMKTERFVFGRWIDEWVDWQVGGQMDRWMDGNIGIWMDEWIEVILANE